MVSATQLDTGGTDSAASSYVTNSISPSANKLLLCAVYSRQNSGVIPTLSGCGLTWVEVDHYQTSDTNHTVTLFRAMGTSPSSGVLTIGFGGNSQQRCLWGVTEFTGMNTTGTNGSGAIVQVAKDRIEVTNTGLTINLAAFGHADNATYGCVRLGDAVSPGSGFSELGENASGTFFEMEFKNSNDQTVDWTCASNGGFGLGIAVEIKAASAGGTGYNYGTVVA